MQIYRLLNGGSVTLVLLLLFPLRSGHTQEGPSLCQEQRPDLCPVKDRLYETYLWSNAGHTYLRLTNVLANVGYGQLFFEPSGPVQNGERPVRQRTDCVTVDDDTLYKYYYPAPKFEFHEGECHDHIHLGKIAKYSIRVYEGLSSPPGITVADGEKVGFCLVDGIPYQQDACCGPYQGTQPSNQVFIGCPQDINASFNEGISVGWQDEYGYFLADQWIDIGTNLSAGRYWLESVVDPDKFIVQASSANDTARIPVFIAYKDLYEPNDSKASVDAMALGGTYSSNLRTCQTTVDNLTIHREFPPGQPCKNVVFEGDVDYFKIYLPRMGGPGHSVAIRFGDSSGTAFKDGNLDLELRNSNDELVLGSYSSDDDEVISLDEQPAGTYYVKVYGRAMTEPVSNSNYYYRLELTLPACGDVNGDGQINSADISVLSSCCGPPTTCDSGNVPCFEKANVNCDSVVDCSDRDYLIDYVFGTGPPPNCNCPP